MLPECTDSYEASSIASTLQARASENRPRNAILL